MTWFPPKENPVTEEKVSGDKIRGVNVKMVEALPPMGEIEYVGVLEAHLKVKVKNEIGGMIEGLHFEKGEQVRKG